MQQEQAKARYAPLTSFRLRDLPRELRDLIYEFAQEPRAIFRHTSRADRDPAYSLPTAEYLSGELNDDGVEISDDELGTLDGFEYAQANDPNRECDVDSCQSAVLTFKVTTTTPLLLVSRDVHAEAKKVLEQTKTDWNEYYTGLSRKTIYMHRIVSPSTVFLDLLSRSQLVLEHSADGSIFFRDNLPEEVQDCVRQLVITNALLAADEPFTGVVWGRCDNTGGTLITDFLGDNFPNLHAVAIQIPGHYDGMEWNWNPASDHICDMLREGRLDTVRFCYKEDFEHVLTDDHFLKHVALESEDSDGESDDEKDTELVGIEELTSTTVPKPELWRDLGVNRVLKITKTREE